MPELKILGAKFIKKHIPQICGKLYRQGSDDLCGSNSWKVDDEKKNELMNLHVLKRLMNVGGGFFRSRNRESSFLERSLK
ncbi:hypothetical protein AYI68_g3812 [Smittium mucronatum]|uniref:Uncharacterized protein n=1 Tax=Smittium mucronatum TaxID=133383 RepID=A0A1R0GYT6_9FUNG|nr:hypothetical protein AYI68_g3812 [Smittium mucronatum]